MNVEKIYHKDLWETIHAPDAGEHLLFPSVAMMNDTLCFIVGSGLYSDNILSVIDFKLGTTEEVDEFKFPGFNSPSELKVAKHMVYCDAELLKHPTQTIHQFDNRRASLYASIRKQIEEGRQIYIVYPLIKESEKMDIKNLEEGYELICAEFPDCQVSKVHGKMKPAEKDAEMQRFVSGDTQIMVATTVIEVGVNVPNASVMVIENAERFGLSQLHQLRGRVGRGADQSYCILVTTYKLTEETRKRLEIMVQTNDGFEIAEADLKLRGPGDLEGTQQSGVAFDLKIADIARDGQLLQYVRDVANRIVDEDPTGTRPENAILWRQLQALRKTNINWAAIS